MKIHSATHRYSQTTETRNQSKMGQTNNEDMEHDETYENYRVIKHNGNNDIDTSRISIRIYDPQGPPR